MTPTKHILSLQQELHNSTGYGLMMKDALLTMTQQYAKTLSDADLEIETKSLAYKIQFLDTCFADKIVYQLFRYEMDSRHHAFCKANVPFEVDVPF